ncbi:Lrp/AsnC family transcriptional regulator [Nocardiopsis potens]|uniref:Lrp/AsnC family transcriptional regulator n=1 Tax=Nocardiopsis potens TaxID=1246458 RepID=UPI000345F57B|nr:Lrp/AsnC family transcriptional regulator [Nocardiopsis potens]
MHEFDLSLINALQLAPRAAWSDLAPILDADATTLARRWRRLEESGLARITVFPRERLTTRRNMAYLELTCRNGTVEQVASALAEDPGTLSIQFTAGSHQLLLTIAPGQGMAEYLMDWIGAFPDVVSYRVHMVTRVVSEAHRWQVRALSPEQRRRLRALAPRTEEADGDDRVTGLDQRIADLLCTDGRMGYQRIAERLDIAPTTAARRLNRLIRSGIIGLRCDIARAEMGWPTAAVLWGTVDPQVLERAEDLGERVPELRLCSTIAGPENTHFIVWLRTVPDLTRVEHRLLEALPGLRIADRRMVLHTFKFMGNVMDREQRYVRTVPLRLRPEEPASGR